MNKVLFFIGMALFLIPLGVRVIVNGKQKDLVSTYEGRWEQTDENKMKECLENAIQYNNNLYEKGIVDLDGYQEQLNILGNGVMCSLEIPKIDLKLPVYHGTEEDVLSNGIGHLKESSLPVGGNSTHCVLSGHRGLPNAELFTRLDELEKGDLFFITVCNQKLGYKVKKIKVVEPENIECIQIENEKDLLSLVTCTPYGLNTHRLVITGQRIFAWETEQEEDVVREVSKRDKLYLVVPGVFALAMILRKVKKSIPVLMVVVLVFCSAEVCAAGNRIEIQFPGKYKESLLCTKIGERVGERFVLKSEYHETGIDLNNIKTAKQMREASSLISDYIEESTVVHIDQNGHGEVKNLEDGIYLIHSKKEEKSKVQPILVCLPTKSESSSEVITTISITPKFLHEEIPNTGQIYFEKEYIILFSVSVIVIIASYMYKKYYWKG